MPYQPLDGPSVYGAISVTTSPIEVKVGGSRFQGRLAVTIQPTDGDIYLGYSNSVSSSNGSIIFKNQLFILEATDSMEVWIVSIGTVNVRIAELA